MSKNINKLHDKAMNFYKNGNLDKALEICEIGIARDLKNSDLLYLKGLLLYIKGDLEGAITVWKINKDFNHDEIARMYINDASEDKDKLNIYEEAKKAINKNNIDEAIEKLKLCNESDFNKINVCYLLAVAYLRKGNYKLAKQYNEEVLNLHRDNKLAFKIKKELKQFLEIDKSEVSIKNKGVLLCLVIIVILVSGFIYIKSNSTDENITYKQEGNKEELNENQEDMVEEENKDIEADINTDTINKVYTDKEIKEAYDLALEFIKEEKFNDAINTLDSIYNNKKDNYLNNHILFLLANSYKNIEDISKSNELYEIYLKEYYGETYTADVLYTLALSYEGNNLIKAKGFAQKIVEDYKDSIYFNTRIEEIINK